MAQSSSNRIRNIFLTINSSEPLRDKSMKYYLIAYVQQDGVHEHIDHAIAQTDSLEKLQELANSEMYDYGESPDDSLFSYGDGETAMNSWSFREVNKTEFKAYAKVFSELK